MQDLQSSGGILLSDKMETTQTKPIDKELEQSIERGKEKIVNYTNEKNTGMLIGAYCTLVKNLSRAGLRDEAVETAERALPVLDDEISRLADSSYLASGIWEKKADLLDVMGMRDEAKDARVIAAIAYRDEIKSRAERRVRSGLLDGSDAFTLSRAAALFRQAEYYEEAASLTQWAAEIFLVESFRESTRKNIPNHQRRGDNNVLMYMDEAIKVLVDGGLISEARPIAIDFMERFRERARAHEKNHSFISAKEDQEQIARVAGMVGLKLPKEQAESELSRLGEGERSYKIQQHKRDLLRRRMAAPISRLWDEVTDRVTSGGN